MKELTDAIYYLLSIYMQYIRFDEVAVYYMLFKVQIFPQFIKVKNKTGRKS